MHSMATTLLELSWTFKKMILGMTCCGCCVCADLFKVFVKQFKTPNIDCLASSLGVLPRLLYGLGQVLSSIRVRSVPLFYTGRRLVIHILMHPQWYPKSNYILRHLFMFRNILLPSRHIHCLLFCFPLFSLPPFFVIRLCSSITFFKTRELTI